MKTNCQTLFLIFKDLLDARSRYNLLFEEVVMAEDKGEMLKKNKTTIQICRELIKNKIKWLERNLNQQIRVTGPEGMEIKIDFQKEIREWQEFYQDYDIRDQNDNPVVIPENLRLTDSSLEKMEKMARKYGFDTVLVIPEGVSAKKLLDNKKFTWYCQYDMDEDLDLISPNLKTRYFDNFVVGDIRLTDYYTEPTKKIQVLLLKQKPRPDNFDWDHTLDTKSAGYQEIVNWQQKNNLTSFDIVSFLICSRYYYDNFIDPGSHENVLPFQYFSEDGGAILLTEMKLQIRGQKQLVAAQWEKDDQKVRLSVYYSDDKKGFGKNCGALFLAELETEAK